MDDLVLMDGPQYMNTYSQYMNDQRFINLRTNTFLNIHKTNVDYPRREMRDSLKQRTVP